MSVSSPKLAGQRELASEPRAPQLSVIVPIRNEEHFIGHTLAELVDQEQAPGEVEIIVVDGDSDDATCSVVERFVERFPHVRLLPNPQRWSSAARNIGVRASRGELLLVVDAHCEIPDKKYFQNLIDAFERSGADAVGRPQPLDVSRANNVQKAIAAARSSRLGHHPASYIYSSEERFAPAHSMAVAYRRSVFERIGYFDERFDACEDVEFNHRLDTAGLRCFFSPSVLVRYHPRATLSGLFRQMTRYGQGRARLAVKHPSTWSLSSFLPALFVLGLAVGLVLSWFDHRLALVYSGTIALYVGIVLATSLGILLRNPRQWRVAIWLPLVFPTIHLGAGWGSLKEFLALAWRRATTRSTLDSQGA